MSLVYNAASGLFEQDINLFEGDAIYSLNEKIVQYLLTHHSCMAKEIAKALNVTRKEVNSLLYGSLKGLVIQDLLYRWSLRQ